MNFKLLLSLMLLMASSITLACYDGYKMNPDGTYVLGGAYDYYKMNPNGTYVISKKCEN